MGEQDSAPITSSIAEVHANLDPNSPAGIYERLGKLTEGLETKDQSGNYILKDDLFEKAKKETRDILRGGLTPDQIYASYAYSVAMMEIAKGTEGLQTDIGTERYHSEAWKKQHLLYSTFNTMGSFYSGSQENIKQEVTNTISTTFNSVFKITYDELLKQKRAPALYIKTGDRDDFKKFFKAEGQRIADAINEDPSNWKTKIKEINPDKQKIVKELADQPEALSPVDNSPAAVYERLGEATKSLIGTKPPEREKLEEAVKKTRTMLRELNINYGPELPSAIYAYACVKMQTAIQIGELSLDQTYNAYSSEIYLKQYLLNLAGEGVIPTSEIKLQSDRAIIRASDNLIDQIADQYGTLSRVDVRKKAREQFDPIGQNIAKSINENPNNWRGILEPK